MASACKSMAGCIEACEPVQATYMNLHRWPDSDAEFVRSLTMKNICAKGDYNRCNIEYARNEKKRKGLMNPSVVDSYSCRQIYLRSYTFSKKESMLEKTVKCLGIVRDKMASISFLRQNDDNFDRRRNITVNSEKENQIKKKKKRKKKECVPTAKKLREVSCNVVSMIFHRLLACAASVDVVDH